MNDHAFEQAYWGDCTNTFDEDQKHYVYAHYMGITRLHWSFQVENKRIIDIGGGPTSMLLKCQDLQEGLVVDPIAYPEWTRQRYAVKNIRVIQAPGESIRRLAGMKPGFITVCNTQRTQKKSFVVPA